MSMGCEYMGKAVGRYSKGFTNFLNPLLNVDQIPNLKIRKQFPIVSKEFLNGKEKNLDY